MEEDRDARHGGTSHRLRLRFGWVWIGVITDEAEDVARRGEACTPACLVYSNLARTVSASAARQREEAPSAFLAVCVGRQTDVEAASRPVDWRGKLWPR